MIQTMPDSIWLAMRSPFSRSSVQTDAPRPNSESLARSIACCSVSTTMIGITGPKISSFMIRMSCVTSVSTVGAMKLPSGKLSISRGPPQRNVAPLATASSIRSLTRSNWSFETIGPIAVSHLVGSPTLSAPASRTAPSMNLSATSRTT